MKRRRLLVAGVGATAAIAGASAALWRRKPVDAPRDLDLWTLVLDRPEGGRLSFPALRGRPVLLNFWATWCPPCVREMPLLERFHREQGAGGWQVVGLAVDRTEAVREFLRRTAVTYPIGMASAEGTLLGRRLGNEAGGLPFTVALNPDGRVAHRKLGALEPGELQGWTQRLG